MLAADDPRSFPQFSGHAVCGGILQAANFRLLVNFGAKMSHGEMKMVEKIIEC
jgi:hypothetical protein